MDNWKSSWQRHKSINREAIAKLFLLLVRPIELETKREGDITCIEIVNSIILWYVYYRSRAFYSK